MQFTAVVDEGRDQRVVLESKRKMPWMSSHFPLQRGIPCVGNHRIVHVIRYGLPRKNRFDGLRGNPYGNAIADGFMTALKVEAVYPMGREIGENTTAHLPPFIEEV